MRVESYVLENGVERPMTEADKAKIAKKFYQPYLQAYLDQEYGKGRVKVNLAG